MATIKVTGLNKETYTINDQNTDYKIDKNEISLDPNQSSNNLAEIQELLGGTTFTDTEASTPWDLKTILAKAGEVKPLPSDPTDAKAYLEQLAKRLEALGKIKSELAQQRGAFNTDTTQDARDQNTALTNQTNAIYSQVLGQLVQAAKEAKKQDIDLPDAAKPFVDVGGGDNAKFGTVTVKTGTGNGAGAQTPAGAGAAGMPQGNGPFGLPPMGMNFKAAFDPSAFFQSSIFMDNRLAALDDINEQQMNGKRIMLFIYYANRAMSGLQGMFEFMRFIGWIINRDKAKQNVQLAGKLIELQDASRKSLDEMMNAKPYDPNDQAVGARFQQIMEKSKADQSMIATDQKLIAQIIEEFGQTSESMMGMQRSLLDANGRELSIASRPT